MDDTTKSFLEKVQELKEKKIKVPARSSGDIIDCSPLTFLQQKNLISTIAEGSIGSLRFQKHLNDIILSNTGKDDLRASDRLPIILHLRTHSVGFEVKFGDIAVDISENVKSSKNLKVVSKASISGDFTINLEDPLIKDENQVISAIIDLVKKDGPDDIGKSVGNIYTYEIVKYIKSIRFGEDELVFRDIPVRDRVKIVENLPLSRNKEIIQFIQSIKQQESELLQVNVDGEEKYFEIDVSFFDS
jgi:hypothetical protein